MNSKALLRGLNKWQEMMASSLIKYFLSNKQAQCYNTTYKLEEFNQCQHFVPFNGFLELYHLLLKFNSFESI